MERKKYILVVVLLFLNFSLLSQTAYKSSIYNAYVNGKMNVWKSVIDRMEKKKIISESYLLELVEFQYGYIAWCLGNDKKNEADDYLQRAINNLNKAEEIGANKAVVLSYKSAFVGFEIAISPPKAPFIGKKSLNYSKDAMKENDFIPIVLINYGNVLFHTPGFYGGDKNEAVKMFLKAKKNMESGSYNLKKDWLYLNLLTLIGKAYEDIEKPEKAKYYYEFALKIEPNFQYVKEDLLPQLEN